MEPGNPTVGPHKGKLMFYLKGTYGSPQEPWGHATDDTTLDREKNKCNFIY